MYNLASVIGVDITKGSTLLAIRFFAGQTQRQMHSDLAKDPRTKHLFEGSGRKLYRSSPVTLHEASDILTWGSAKMSGLGIDQGAGAPSAAVLRSPGEPGKASPIRRGGRIAKRIRRREPGKTVAVWSSISQSAWAACVRCGELSGAKVILSSLSETRMSPVVANSSCSRVRPS